MDWFELIKYLAGLLPPGVLGGVIVIIAGLYIHRSKKIPWKIVRAGVNGSTTVTADMLKNHCLPIHAVLELNISRIVSLTDEIKVDNRETRKEIVLIGKKIATLEERTAHHQRTN